MDYIEGCSEIPLSTYFVGDYDIGAPKVLSAVSRDYANLGFKMDGLKVAENLFWLQGSGKFTFRGRHLRVNTQQFGTYSQDDADALRALAEEPGVVDLFLTNEWPCGVTSRASASEIPAGISDSSGSDPVVAELAGEIKPHYHIAGT